MRLVLQCHVPENLQGSIVSGAGQHQPSTSKCALQGPTSSTIPYRCRSNVSRLGSIVPDVVKFVPAKTQVKMCFCAAVSVTRDAGGHVQPRACGCTCTDSGKSQRMPTGDCCSVSGVSQSDTAIPTAAGPVEILLKVVNLWKLQ